MDEVSEQVAALYRQGLCCAQIVMKIVGLDLRQEENPDLVRAMGALCYGLHDQRSCGALTGGACALALHTDDGGQMNIYASDLLEWFEGEYGSTECRVLLGEWNAPTSLCREIVANTVSRCLTLLDGATWGS
jgi:hypothetical protein